MRGGRNSAAVLILATVLLSSGCRRTWNDSGKTASVDPIPSYASLPRELPARIASLRKTVDALSAASPTPTSAAWSCSDFAGLWIEILNTKHGYKLHYAQTEGVGTVKLQDGSARRQDKIHAFTTDRALCSDGKSCASEVIIDPTYLQFFELGECLFDAEAPGCEARTSRRREFEALEKLPRIFVGTHRQLEEIFERHSTLVRMEQTNGSDALVGRYDPRSAASLIYSFGQNESLRLNLQ